MSKGRLFLDTVFIQALYNARDQYYAKALALLPLIEAAAEVWITEAILIEVGNGLSAVIDKEPLSLFSCVLKLQIFMS